MHARRWSFSPILLIPLMAWSQTLLTENLQGATSSYPWQAIGGACLTAGNNTGSIPSCISTGFMNAPADLPGKGALRLTDNGGSRAGGVISKFSFPANRGMQVTFTSVTYGGNNLGGTGADGMAFFLIDADQVPVIGSSTHLGALGGALGYSSRGGWDTGIVGGYLGIGIDEYGNFSNPVDNGTVGPGFLPNTISLRSSQATHFTYIAGVTLGANISSASALTRSAAAPITFSLLITPEGLLNVSFSRQGGLVNPVLTNFPIKQSNGVLPTNYHFGFSAGSGAGTNFHEIVCFNASDTTTSGSSAGVNLLLTAKVQAGSQVYVAYYHTQNWWGEVTAQDILVDTITGTVSVNPVASWDASCVLTGGICAVTGQSLTAQSPLTRTILSFDGTQGVPFQSGSLAPDQRTALAAGASTAPLFVNYLRGDRSLEGFASASLRSRTSLLGDVMNSSPVWVGPAMQSAYATRWKDALNPQTIAPEGTYYADFMTATATRTNVVYVGANDGMLHGFRSGAYTASGAFDTTAQNDGKELLAYVPYSAVRTLSSHTPQLFFGGQLYAHNAYVDATPAVGDLYYQGAWHTWLVSGLGAGGNTAGVVADRTSVASGALFALDITNPGIFSEANASRLVLGDWRSDSLQCVTDTPAVHCADNLGSTYGTPTIRRLHDGNWAVIFGNGYNSVSGHAGVFIMRVDSVSGARTFRFLDTGSGSTADRNGIAYVTPVDLDYDNVIDFLYAGDLFGNVWRFDLTSNVPANWHVRTEPVFQTGRLPVTTRILATPVVDALGNSRIILNFGTGQVQPQTTITGSVPNPQQQYLFGVWDWDQTGWNQLAGSNYVALSRSAAGVPATITLSPAQLQSQTITTNAVFQSGSINGVRTVSQNPVCWNGSGTCRAPLQNNQFGWRMALTGNLEQAVYNPVLLDGLFVISTLIPSDQQVLSCGSVVPHSGFTMAVLPDQGTAPLTSYFASATASNRTLGNVAGIGLSAVGTPTRIVVGNKAYLMTQGSGTTPLVTEINPPSRATQLRHITWEILR